MGSDQEKEKEENEIVTAGWIEEEGTLVLRSIVVGPAASSCQKGRGRRRRQEREEGRKGRRARPSLLLSLSALVLGFPPLSLGLSTAPTVSRPPSLSRPCDLEGRRRFSLIRHSETKRRAEGSEGETVSLLARSRLFLHRSNLVESK